MDLRHTAALLCLCLGGRVYAAQQQINPPVLIKKPMPQMPADPALAKKGGRCRVSIVIGTTGMPKDPKVLACTDPGFEPNSLGGALNYRFKPATLSDGKPVEAHVKIDIYFLGASRTLVELMPPKVRSGFVIQPDGTPAGPDAKGVYALTNLFVAPNIPPKMTQFANNGFGSAAFGFPPGTACEAELTINAKGKASDLSIKKCDEGELYHSASESLLNSKYDPAILNGKAVPVRASIRLVFDGYEAKR